MIANLPLLFANGNPTALSKITAAELEQFITFMVTCSWGHDTAKDIRQPPWWPDDVTFSHPFARPGEVPKDWEVRLKNLVKKCYEYHKSAFLLVFSAQLARYPQNRLRYVDNRDHTTSLYYRPNGRLLVTFRNENLFYDKSDPKKLSDEAQLKSTDIYLCDNCDSHFDNLEILTAHERLCNNENVPSITCSGGLPEFLSALKLLPLGQKPENTSTNGTDNDLKPKNVRNAANIDRGPPYPFSSLAYIRNVKPNPQRDMTYSRERVERYCCTTMPKQNNGKIRTPLFPVRYRRPIDYWQRKHTFPDQRHKKILSVAGQLLLLKCRPISVNMERMSQKSMDEYIDKLKAEADIRKQQMEDIVYVDGLETEPIDAEMKSLDPLKRVDSDCEVIDLCSDDESPSVNENCDPRAGVTCVMRGGAVLRRQAGASGAGAAPGGLPAAPCGARHRPLPTVLQPHPVLLIAHTLNNLQTISLD